MLMRESAPPNAASKASRPGRNGDRVVPKHPSTRKPKSVATPKNRAIINRAPSPSWISGWRQKIATSQLINRLQTFALADPDDPAGPRLTRTQAMVALSLLRKVLPDMQSIEVSGNSDQPITVQILRFADPLDDSLTNAAVHQHAMQNGSKNGSAPMLGALDEPLTIDVEARPIEDDPEPVSPGRTRGRKRNQ
jgi:hypothetical protein